MDINLPLILLVATSGTGAVWLLDALFFSRERKAKEANVETEFGHLDSDAKNNDVGYLQAVEAVRKEPPLVEYSKSFFPVLAIVFVLRGFIVEPFQIPSGSMIPTLEVGDFIVVSKSSYGIRMPVFRTKLVDFGMPERGEVVVFFPPHEERYFIKRLIGLPGDQLQYKNHQLTINGEPVPQEWLEEGEACYGDLNYQLVQETIGDHHYTTQKCPRPSRLSIDGTWVVPEGHYFMVGDNRDNSADSRQWLYVPDENLVGKAFAIWMHWDKNETFPSFKRASLIE